MHTAQLQGQQWILKGLLLHRYYFRFSCHVSTVKRKQSLQNQSINMHECTFTCLFHWQKMLCQNSLQYRCLEILYNFYTFIAECFSRGFFFQPLRQSVLYIVKISEPKLLWLLKYKHLNFKCLF